MRRILVVDDDAGMVRTLQDVLRLHGWDVHGAASGKEAVALVDQHEYTAVIMDVKMPGLDGVQAFRMIHERHPGLPVLLMTAYASDDAIREALRGGVTRVLPKPLDLRYTLRLLDDVLASTQAVLIIDDEREFLSTLADALRAHGHAVLESTSLEDALLLAGDGARVVLLHLHLDALDPARVVQSLKSVNPEAALIVYSGRPDAFLERAASAPEVLAALPKPLPMEQLLAIVDGALGR